MSSALVASSKIITSGFLIIALAIEILCLCPPESLSPCSPMFVSSPSGSFFITASRFAALIAALSFASLTLVFPYVILSRIVPLKSTFFLNISLLTKASFGIVF